MKCVYWECVRNHFRLIDGRQAKCFIITCTSPSIFPLLATRLLEHWALHYWINLHHHTNVEREREWRWWREWKVQAILWSWCRKSIFQEHFFFLILLFYSSELYSIEEYGMISFLLCKCHCNNAKYRENILESENDGVGEEKNWGFSRRGNFFILKIQLF